MRVFGAANLAKGLATLAAGLWCSAAISASATTFAFDQTGSSVPGFVVSASISVDGALADLPAVSNINNPGPYNFSPLLALDIMLPSLAEGHYTLIDFTAPSYFGYPLWSISPGGISYINATDTTDFIIAGFGATSTIEFESDGPTTPRDCMLTGHCIATGHWDPAAMPEPASALVLLAGLVGSALPLRKRNRSARPGREAPLC